MAEIFIFHFKAMKTYSTDISFSGELLCTGYYELNTIKLWIHVLWFLCSYSFSLESEWHISWKLSWRFIYFLNSQATHIMFPAQNWWSTNYCRKKLMNKYINTKLYFAPLHSPSSSQLNIWPYLCLQMKPAFSGCIWK